MSRRTKKKNEEQKKKKDVTRKEGRTKMTPTAEEKRKSIHTRKTREFSRMRIAYLRQTSFNGKIAFLYVRVPTHFVYFCVYVYSLARARSSKKCDVLRENLSFFFPRAVFFEVREWSNAPEIDIWQTSSIWWRPFFLMSTKRRWWVENLCVWVRVCGC